MLQKLSQIVGLMGLGLALGACTLFGDRPEFLAPASNTVERIDRDIEAPDVFQLTANAQWDGRPSLGGVWIAHKDIGDPLRAIIRVPNTDRFVVGSLFRKDPGITDVPFQVSSDAAAALGMIAGQPMQLNVTALRRQETAPVTAAPQPAPAPAGVLAPLGTPGTAPVTASAIEAPAPKVTASAPDRPFIQVGIFSVQANADATAAALTTAGAPAQVKQMEAGGKTFWRVIAGPANSEQSRDALLTKVHAQGFSDAYAVKN